jgi:hypothetical protein
MRLYFYNNKKQKRLLRELGSFALCAKAFNFKSNLYGYFCLWEQLCLVFYLFPLVMMLPMNSFSKTEDIRSINALDLSTK